jgi:hypothetical protein
VQPPDATSQHPVDLLIVRLIRQEVDASPADVGRIVQRMATAPFNQHPVRVPGQDRGLIYSGAAIGRTSAPLSLHLAKRVVQDEQWTFGTTEDEYLADLRTAAQHPQARTLVYERTTDYVSATISPTVEVVPVQRLGRRSLPLLVVIYSARHGVLRTGYMYSDFSKLDMPEAIRWLR